MSETDPSEGHKLSESAALHDRALDVFPGGVSHNIRYFSPHPLYIERAEGPYIWDADGNAYLDYWMNHMASVLGHSHPAVVDAVREQLEDGLHYGAVNEKALELGEKVQEYVPSAERLRFCSSGTEATMYAVRLARAYTDCPIVLKAQGGWHGGNSELSNAIHAPFDVPSTDGRPPGADDSLRTYPVNDRATVERLLDEHAGDVAAIIIEPWMLAGGGLSVDESFLRFLRAESNRRDIVLIFDEVVTGFRFSPGSYQKRVGITPDLTTLGKFLGGGLPVGGLAGRAELFEAARPDIDVPPGKSVIAGGGTFSMNPMTATAGLASLAVVESEPVYEYTESQAQRVRDRLTDLFDDLGIEGVVLGESSMFLTHFDPETTLNTVETVETRTNRQALATYHRRLFEHGHYFLPTHVGSVSYQTTEQHLDGLVEASRVVLSEMRDEGLV